MMMSSTWLIFSVVVLLLGGSGDLVSARNTVVTLTEENWPEILKGEWMIEL